MNSIKLLKTANNHHNVFALRNISLSSRLFAGKDKIRSLVSWFSQRYFGPTETPIKMPALSPTMSSGVIVKWHKKEGEKINPGDILCEVQTDKAIVAYEFDDEAVLAKIVVEEGSKEINVGELIAILCEEGDDWKSVKIPTAGSEPPPPSAETKQAGKKKLISWDKIRISPSARNLMVQYGIHPKSVSASGPKNTLLKSDVWNFISKNNLKYQDLSKDSPKTESKPAVSAPVPVPVSTVVGLPKSDYIDLEISSMRRTIAKRLTESKCNTPHAYMSMRCSMDELIQLRANLKSQSIAVSLNDLIVKATAIALKQVPAMNCQWTGESVQLLREVDISIAVATPTGLITPIIRNANRLSLDEINTVSRDLIGRAKEAKLKPEEFLGGSFSISNLGMFDIDHFTGVINPPQAAILAVGSTRKVFTGEPDDYRLRSRMCATLSYDARAIEEETAALFLEKLQSALENPSEALFTDGTEHRRLSAFL